MDDVDDFDGYREVREILPNVLVTFEVSVMGVFTNRTNYPVSCTGVASGSQFIQSPYGIVPPISYIDPANVLGIDFSAANPNDAQQQILGFYNQILFKKITVKASWTYPLGSTSTHTLVLDGGKVNPLGVA